MYQTIKVGDWVIEADMEETRKQYEKDIDDMCVCGNCLNFHAAVRIARFRRFRSSAVQKMNHTNNSAYKQPDYSQRFRPSHLSHHFFGEAGFSLTGF